MAVLSGWNKGAKGPFSLSALKGQEVCCCWGTFGSTGLFPRSENSGPKVEWNRPSDLRGSASPETLGHFSHGAKGQHCLGCEERGKTG